jgi:hypothetical protein
LNTSYPFRSKNIGDTDRVFDTLTGLGFEPNLSYRFYLGTLR